MSLLSFLFAGPAPTRAAPRKPLRRFYEVCTDIPADYTVIDIETSGLDACTCEILEIGALRVRNNVETAHYQTYIKPVGAISESAKAVNGLTWKKLYNQPAIDAIRQSFFEFIGNDVLVGHNIGFDIKFIQTRFELNLRNECFDTLKWSRIAFPDLQSYKLDTLRTTFSLGGTSHSAVGDCIATHHLLQRIAKAEIVFDRYTEDQSPYVVPGYEHWLKGEQTRIAGNLDDAIVLFQLAESEGYNNPALYISYAKIYRKRKEYEQEISIIEKALQTFTGVEAIHFSERRDRVKELLLAKQKREELLRQKEIARECKAEARQKKAELAASKPKRPIGRSIAQCSDDGSIIAEYTTVSSAARTVGISEKSIRDAANGKQHHAGGFCWRYTDTDHHLAEIDTKTKVSNLDT